MKCSFCGAELPFGGGKMNVAGDGTVSYFCSSKCERNSRMREPVKVRWTSAFRKEKAARIKEVAKKK